MANNRFVGVIESKTELNTTKTKEKAVINFMVGKTRELMAGIQETVKARIVMFGPDAEVANAKIDAGKVVLFSDVRRNPRTYVTDAGTTVESVDLIATSFHVLNKKDYEAAKDELEKLCIGTDQLEFTDQDRKTLEKAEAAAAASVA